MLVWGWQGREGTYIVCVCRLLACGRLAEIAAVLLCQNFWCRGEGVLKLMLEMAETLRKSYLL